MGGWQKLWQDPEVVKTWTGMSPVTEVVMLADRLAAEPPSPSDAEGDHRLRGPRARRRVLDIGCGLGRRITPRGRLRRRREDQVALVRARAEAERAVKGFRT